MLSRDFGQAVIRIFQAFRAARTIRHHTTAMIYLKM